MFKFFKTIRALTKLRTIEPDTGWLKTLRSQFTPEEKTRHILFQQRLAPALVVFVLILVFITGTFNYAQAARPSDFFYPLELLAEQAQAFFIVGNEKKIDFALRLAEERLEEAGTENDGIIVAGTVVRAEQNLQKAQVLLERFAEKGKQTVGIEKHIQKTLARLERLAEQKQKLAEKLSSKLPEVAAALQGVEIASVNVEQAANQIVVTFNLAPSATSSTSTRAELVDVLRARAEKAIERAQKQIELREGQLGITLSDAHEKLDDARDEFAEGDYVSALEKANGAFKKAVKAHAQDNEDEENDADDEDDEDNEDAENHGTQRILELLTDGAGKSGKVPPGLLRAPGIRKKLGDIFPTSTLPDSSAPVISNVSSTNITHNSAVITWQTNEPADSRVDYGTSTEYGLTVKNENATTSHSITLSNLQPQTLYHFRVRSEDASHNKARSGDFTFTTASAPDVAAPVISGIQATNITTSSAKVVWQTNEAADSLVRFGETSAYGNTATNTALVTSHEIILSGLLASTTIHFQVQSQDASGNSASSSDQTFITLAPPPPPDTSAPTLSDIAVADIASTSATVLWTTNEVATSKVYYSTTSPVNTATASSQANAALTTSHSISLLSLTASTTYYFIAESADAAGNTATSSESSFATLAD